MKNYSIIDEKFNQKIREKISDKFDLSVIGRIDLIEAEKIAQEDVLFLSEEELIEGLEEFELVPLAKIKHEPNYDKDKIILEDQKSDHDETPVINITDETDDQQNRILYEAGGEDFIADHTEVNDINQLSQTLLKSEKTPDDLLFDNTELIEHNEIQTSEELDLSEAVEQNEIIENSEESEVRERLIDELNLSSEIIENQHMDFNKTDEQLIVENQHQLENFGLLKDRSKYIISDFDLFENKKLFIHNFFHSVPDIEFINNIIMFVDFDGYINNIDNYSSIQQILKSQPVSIISDSFSDDIDFIEEKIFNYIKISTPEHSALHDNALTDIDKTTEMCDSELNKINFPVVLNDVINYLNEQDQKSGKYIIEETESELNNYLDKLQKQKNNIDLEKAEVTELYYQDITDKVVIIEDKKMLMEFADRYPKKHGNLVKLLSYLDGLFEKLPEEVIHKFVESDYFDLYSTLLQQMGD